jgi:hypothetical protein
VGGGDCGAGVRRSSGRGNGSVGPAFSKSLVAGSVGRANSERNISGAPSSFVSASSANTLDFSDKDGTAHVHFEIQEVNARGRVSNRNDNVSGISGTISDGGSQNNLLVVVVEEGNSDFGRSRIEVGGR